MNLFISLYINLNDMFLFHFYESDSLREFFEEHFGPVEDARVAGFQTGKQIQSRGFGFVTFVHEESVSEAVEARYVTIMGKKVEIKSAIPKFLVLAELQKQAAQRREANNKDQSQLQALTPDKKTTEEMSARKIEEEIPTRKSEDEMPCRETLVEEKLEQQSWADRLLLCQPMTSATESQADVSTPSGDQNMPKWLRIFKKWLPRFLQHVYKFPIEGEYALSSLKADFKAAFQLEMDHASLGYPKLSDFVRTFPDICTVKSGTLSNNRSPNHMVLLPSSIPKPKLKVLHQLKKHHPSFPEKSIGDSDDSDSCDSKSPQDLPLASSASIGLTTRGIEGNSSHEVTEDSTATSRRENSAHRSTSSGVPQMFARFTNPDMFSVSQIASNQGADEGSRDQNDGRRWMEPSEGIRLMLRNRHLVLQWLATKRKNTSVFFLREFDFYPVSNALHLKAFILYL